MNKLLHLADQYTTTVTKDLVQQFDRRFPEVFWMGDKARPEIALSFDDGPHPRDTPALLEVLARHKVQATFSWLGARAEAHLDLVAAAARAGHQLMIHGYRHRPFLLERAETLRDMLAYTQGLLAQHSGREPATIRAVRPPYGFFSAELIRSLYAWGYQPILGSMMPFHWLQSARSGIRRILAQVEAGSLIVMHEGQSGPPVSLLVDGILEGLRERQFAFVTVDALRASRHLA
jgi:peptidoglycan/xylan/chitin deacetylase (PgdA/CDA1 family)